VGQNGTNGTKGQCSQKFLYEPTGSVVSDGFYRNFWIRVPNCPFVPNLSKAINRKVSLLLFQQQQTNITITLHLVRSPSCRSLPRCPLVPSCRSILRNNNKCLSPRRNGVGLLNQTLCDNIHTFVQ